MNQQLFILCAIFLILPLVCAHKMRMGTRGKVNISLPIPLISVTKTYCDGRDFSEFVADVIRRHFERLNIPVDILPGDVLVSEKKALQFQTSQKLSTKPAKSVRPAKSAGLKSSHG